MKRLIVVLSSVALMLGMAQCRKNLGQMTPAAASEGTIEVSLTAGYDGNDKTDITPEGMVSWTTGDKIYVVGETKGYLGELTLVSESPVPSNKGVFNGDLSEWTGMENLHFYYLGTENSITSTSDMERVFDFSIQNGTMENIIKNMHIAHGVKKGVPAGETKLGSVSMHNMISIAKFDISGYTAPMKCCGVNVLTGGTLNFKTGTWTSTTKGEFKLNGKNLNFFEYYMVLMPSETEQEFTFKQNDADATQVVKKRVIEAGKFYTGGTSKDGEVKPIAVKTRPAHTLPGVFTVSADGGKKVRFSRGNLYAVRNGSDIKLRFENNQYDFRTINTKTGTSYGENQSVIDNNWVTCAANECGLLAWSSDKLDVPAPDNVIDWGFPVGYDGETSHFTGNFLDWGRKEIENGENRPNQWKTLESAQLMYLLGNKVNTPYRYARGIVGTDKNRRVILIFPDGWDASLYSVPELNQDNPMGDSSKFKISIEDWDDILEPAGVVMLPISHYHREKDKLVDDNTTKLIAHVYWTATPATGSEYVRYAETLYYDGIKVDQIFRSRGLMVRLVKDVE